MADTEADDRTEAPTSQRLQKAREEGNVAQSRELQNLVGLGFGLVTMAFWMKGSVGQFVIVMRSVIEHAGDHSTDFVTLHTYITQCMQAGLRVVLPIALATVCGAVGSAAIQTGFLFRIEGLLPDISRVNPGKGLGRITGGDTLAEAGKSFLKFSAFCIVCTLLTRQLLTSIGNDAQLGTYELIKGIFTSSIRALMLMLMLQVVIAVIDAFWVHWRRLSKLKMSRQEQKDEYKQTEGDPLVKNKMRQLRAKLSRQKMMKAMPTATVVVTNPTHYAVALYYQQGAGNAPRIVAKGMDDLAERIRDAATDNRIPIVSNPPLARALYVLPLDSEIPHEHFKVVAGIIAYVWKLKKPAGVQAPVR